jgi:hypothetical protein
MASDLSPRAATAARTLQPRDAASPEELASVAAALERIVDVAARDYQLFQLAAQRADLEGHALAAGILRSISESHTGKAHALLGVLARLESSASSSAKSDDPTRRNVIAALSRGRAADALDAAALATLPAQAPPHLRDDIEAALKLTATNRMRLEALAQSLSPKAAN